MSRDIGGPVKGTQRYVDSLIRALLDIDHDNEYVVYYNSASCLGGNPTAKEKVINMPAKMLWDHIGIPMAARQDSIDLLFCPKNVVPPMVTCKTVVTVLDLGYLTGRYYPRLDSLYMNMAMRYSTRKANAVIAISNSTKSDIISYLGVKPEKIHAIHLAADENYRLLDDKALLESIKTKYNLPPFFILAFLSLQRRKNLQNLVKAFSIVKKKNQLEHKLVFVGPSRSQHIEIEKAVGTASVKNDVIWLKAIPEQDLPAIYNLADIFVYPSLYEGFGLPVLEAMACGCPVVCSNTSSMPEVVGDAAVLIDPVDVEQIANGIYSVLSDSVLKEGLKSKGLKRASQFSWGKTAKETLEVFKMIQL